MDAPEFWDIFLEYIANSEFTHQRTLQRVFIERFIYRNWEVTISSIADSLELINNHDDPDEVERANNQVRANLRRIYRHFDECNYAKQGQKFRILREWLLNNRYPQWRERYLNEISSGSGAGEIYIERPPIEQNFYEEALNPGAFIRIRAPQQMGKTLLINRVLTRLREEKGYHTLVYDFGLEDSEVFEGYRRFIQCFCTGITNELNLGDCLSEYWSELLGCNRNATTYFEKHLLDKQNKPLIIVLTRLDCVFEHPNIAGDFCKLLRSWHENSVTENIWKSIKIVVSHSTDVYGSFDINTSPLAGIGTVFTLPEFNIEQVKEFASFYQLDLTNTQIVRLINLIGGHPYLLKQAFEYLQINSSIWEHFLKIAPTEASPFIEHLTRNLQVLQEKEELKQGFIQVIDSQQPIFLTSDCRFKLQGMGLVRLLENESSPRCDLYRHYFARHLNRNHS